MCGCGRLDFERRALPDGAVVGDDATMMMIDAADALPTGLVARLPLDGNLADVISGVPGICTSCPGFVAGQQDGGAQFDGTDDCVTVPNSQALSPAQITIAVWARHASMNNVSLIARSHLTGSSNSWQLETDLLEMNPLAMTFTAYDGNQNSYTTTPQGTVLLDVWQHIAASYDGDIVRVYLDGVEQASSPHNALMYDDKPVKIGCDDNDGEAIFFQGTLDEVQIYNRALTGEEVAKLAAR